MAEHDGRDMLLSVDGAVSPDLLAVSIRSILASTRLLSLATVSDGGTPWANHAYFACDQDLCLYFLSEPTSQHAMNLARTPAAAVVVADTQQTGDGGKRGLQLYGRCGRASDVEHALNTFGARFGDFGLMFPSVEALTASGMQSVFFEFVPESVKVFDEPRFGEGTWVCASVAH